MTANLCSRCRRGTLRMPATTRPMTTIRAPATSSRTGLWARKGSDRALAVASRRAKTTLKPATNSRVDHSTRARWRCSSARSSPLAPDLTDTPDIMERYDGTRGSTHGERKDTIPAPKATMNPRGERCTSAPSRHPPSATRWSDMTSPLLPSTIPPSLS